MTVQYNTPAKEFFKNWDNGNHMRSAHNDLVNEIVKWKPRNIFEFGCGNGKILNLLRKTTNLPDHKLQGVDIAKSAIAKGIRWWNLCIWHADESCLRDMQDKSFDVVYTVSVLDHIEDIEEIMKQFARIAQHIIVLETNASRPGAHYYPHDYESYGLLKIEGWSSTDFGDGCIYEMWKTPS